MKAHFRSILATTVFIFTSHISGVPSFADPIPPAPPTNSPSQPASITVEDTSFPDQVLLRTAEAGNARAQCQIGLDYSSGAGVTCDYQKARVWYQKAADQGDAEALRHLANLSRYGQDGHKDAGQALELYRKAAACGDTDAVAFLCDMAEAGEGAPASSARAMESYNQLLKLANQGNIRAEMWVGFFNLSGIAAKSAQTDPDVNPPTGDQDIEPPIADVGDAIEVTIKLGTDADFELPAVDGLEAMGKRTGVEIKIADGKSAEIHSSIFGLIATRPGSFTIPAFDVHLPGGGVAHEHEMKLFVRGTAPGAELPADPDAAFDWLTKSASAGDGEASYYLAIAYKRPGRNGVSPQMGEKYAADWLHRSAEDGYAPAQAMLGGDYANGTGMAIDHAKALYWERKAADQGNVDGEAGLGVLYAVGHGTPPNAAEAVKWEQRAIAGGNIEAKYLLGKMYDDGTAGTSDHALAVKWYTDAAAGGCQQAKEALIGPSLSHAWSKDEWRSHVPANDIQPNGPFGVAGSICTRNALYEAVGMPDHTQTIDGSKLLYWICTDGQIQVECNEQSFANGKIIGRINDF